MNHPIENLWREVGLPEYFLGNGGTNRKLFALYDAIRKQKMKFVNPMDRIEELETALEKAAVRIEALEAALCRIRDDGKNCVDHCRRQAGRALARAALDKADKAG